MPETQSIVKKEHYLRQTGDLGNQEDFLQDRGFLLHQRHRQTLNSLWCQVSALNSVRPPLQTWSS